MSQKLYANDAERQRAFRDRQRLLRGATMPSTKPPPPRKAKLSRPRRILAMAEEARRLAADYQHWRDSLPGNLAEGETASRLEEVVTELEEVADLLDALDPPTVGR